jgi:geranylgeranyl pyrophosphate synthase
MVHIGSLDYVLKKGGKYIASAKSRCDALPNTQAKKDLFALVDYFTSRKY